MSCLDTLQARRELCADGESYKYYALDVACSQLNLDIGKLPFVHRVLLENLLRHEDGYSVKLTDLQRFAECVNHGTKCEINFMPVRVMMQDFTGVPALVDLAAMRDYMRLQGKDPSIINPRIPVDLVIDHSLQVDFSGTGDALSKNVALEMSRNLERYRFLKWSQQAFRNLRVVPPGTGICHQVNLEYLAQVVWNVDGVLCPDTVIGTDSHTTMINGISVLGWGVGGIEAEAAMLGQPIAMTVPEVVGFEISGKLREGVTATDMVLTITDMLRRKKVVGKFVEFYGDGLKNLTVFDRATVANMAPEYGATCGYFPFDQSTLDYLDITGRDRTYIKVVESYVRTQHLWYHGGGSVNYSDKIGLDLSDVAPVVAGPKRPQDRIVLSKIADTLPVGELRADGELPVKNGDVVIAAITSCTNTSNPYVMIAAGLIARKARKLGLRSKPWVKTSLTPGSQVVEAYLKASGLQQDLDHLGFNIVGYGCATCIGNSGPLAQEIEESITTNNLLVASVLSGNRNFEGRVHPCVKANFLASPPVVVLFALSGTVLRDITKDAICQDDAGNDIFLKDLWPTNQEISEIIEDSISRDVFLSKYANVFLGDEIWQNVKSVGDVTYEWSPDSTYVQNPPYFIANVDSELQAGAQSGGIKDNKLDIRDARILMLLGDSITTDHISPAGNIPIDSPAGKFLTQQGVKAKDFNSYGSRRGNHNIMMRGTFANIRIKNEMLKGVEGGFTRHYPSDEVLTIYDAAMRYGGENVPLVIIAGKEYGTGSSRDWAAKGTILLGIKAVIAESFERIHRSNLVGMGVLPLIFKGETRSIFTGEETLCLSGQVGVRKTVKCEVSKGDGSSVVIDLECAVNTAIELDYLAVGGVLHYVLKRMVSGTQR